MTPDTPNPASAAARTGSGKHHKRLASEVSGFTPPARLTQAQILRFPPPPPRPRHFQVRITASDSRAPIGRTRPLRLTESDLQWLLDAAVRLEARK
jgi:hypothetical protein